MSSKRKWEILARFKSGEEVSIKRIVERLLLNRGIKGQKEKKEFFQPTHPEKISLRKFGIDSKDVKKTIERIKKAKEKKEKVIVYGDYDADGICGTAIIWEVLFAWGLKVLPYIPERFSEGYGLNEKTVERLKEEDKNLKLIIAVDNGIVAFEAVKKANNLGIDVIICDHHEKGEKYPQAHSIIHTANISASAIAWVLSREIRKKFKYQKVSSNKYGDGLELAGIGTIADQLPLVGVNRSFAKHGLVALNKTKRKGLKALFEQAMLKPGLIDTYAVGFIIAPRINAMGRLEHAIESLRLLCTKNPTKARDLAFVLGKVNSRRQKIVEKALVHARRLLAKKKNRKIVILADDSYHEGVIGLMASEIVEELNRPTIVIAKGRKISKASARSIPKFNLIKFLRSEEALLEELGGHSMAAGFSLMTNKIDKFCQKIEKKAARLLTKELLMPISKIDLELDFAKINYLLAEKLKQFEPVGIANPTPTFLTKDLCVLDARVVGRDGKHLKLKLEKEGKAFWAIAFGLGDYFPKIRPDKKIDVVYSLELNEWNGDINVELKIKDIKID